MPCLSFGDQVKEKKEVISVVNNFFKVLETKDIDLAGKIMLPGSCYFSTREIKGKMHLTSSTYDDFMKGLTLSKYKLREEMFYPAVLIHKEIAILWVRFEVYRDEKLAHCGVDSFSLIKVEGKWKIASVVYTVETEGCK